jgi:hypothetical protein
VLSKGGQMRGFISARLSPGISALYVFENKNIKIRGGNKNVVC